jgi:hypothetical protein
MSRGTANRGMTGGKLAEATCRLVSRRKKRPNEQ